MRCCENKKSTNEYDKIILNAKNNPKCPPFEYLVVEDVEKKTWVTYSCANGLYKEVSFGDYVNNFITMFLRYDKNNPQHNNFLKLIGNNFDEKNANSLFDKCKADIDELMQILPNIAKYYFLAKKGELTDANESFIDCETLDITLFNIWKKYRYFIFTNVWGDFSEYSEEELTESNNILHDIVSKDFVFYYDNISFIDANGNSRVGRCFLTSNDFYMFVWDLYHVLVSKLAKMPRVCPRCNSLFFSNNNKSLYCAGCKEESNVIRNEKRSKSVRYLHKRIYDRLRNSKSHSDTEKELFLAESNYYWDIVRKKNVKEIPLFTAKIETETDYKTWLENKLHFL